MNPYKSIFKTKKSLLSNQLNSEKNNQHKYN